MSRQALPVARYWFRANFAQRWSTYVSIVLLIGLVGGIAIGSMSAARRTASSFNVFLASSNPSDMSVFLFAPNVTAKLANLPLVRHVATASYGLYGFPVGRRGAPLNVPAIASGAVAQVGVLNGEYFSQDKVTVIDGQMANPKKADEFVMTADAEQLMGWHLGQAIPMYFYTTAQSSLPGYGTAKVKPHLRMTMHLVGTVVLNQEVVSDKAEREPLMIFTPTFTRPFDETGVNYNDYTLQLVHGTLDVSKVEREIIAALPPHTTYSFQVTSLVSGEVNRSIEPDAIALGVFGLIAMLAALIIAGGLVARALLRDDDDINVLRALGADPWMTRSAGLIGLLGAIVIGSLLAAVVGVALSPLSPIGPVRLVYPDEGLNFDWPVLAVGTAFLVVAVGAIALILARRRSPGLMSRRKRLVVPTGSRLARLLVNAGLPVTAAVGVRFAVEPGRDRDAVPVRSALLGSALALTIVVATLTFGSSLNTLVTHPPLYGWNWNYAMDSGAGIPPQSTRLLSTDPYVRAWSGYGIPNVQIDGTTVPVLTTAADAAVSPPLLSGHGVDAVNQIVLGAATMKQLHKHAGNTVVVSYGNPKDAPVYVPPTRLTIVGTATLPSLGGALTLNTSMGVGAIISSRLEPAKMRKFIASPYATLDGPQVVFVRLRTGAPRAAALKSLNKIAAVGDRAFAAVPQGHGQGDSVTTVGVQYPAEIQNYRSIGVTPDVLALALAAGAVVALGLTLTASVRRRRRDLALLRTLGFTRRQLMATVAWQASVAGVLGVIAGVPLGILLGRWLWTLFARNIYAVPEPTVSVLSVTIVAISALVLANIVAALPGRSAARTSTAQVLRGE